MDYDAIYTPLTQDEVGRVARAIVFALYEAREGTLANVMDSLEHALWIIGVNEELVNSTLIEVEQ